MGVANGRTDSAAVRPSHTRITATTHNDYTNGHAGAASTQLAGQRTAAANSQADYP